MIEEFAHLKEKGNKNSVIELVRTATASQSYQNRRKANNNLLNALSHSVKLLQEVDEKTQDVYAS